jgi:aspartate aminotransferase
LRTIVAEKFRRENGIDSSADRVLITSGGKHALGNALLALAEGGDEIIIPSPFWASYSAIAYLSEGTPVIVKTTEEDSWLLRPEQLERSIAPNSRVLMLNTPVNPTSAVYSKEDLLALVPIIKEHELLVVVDELYEKLTYDGRKHFSIGSVAEIADQVVTINGLSKAYAMTGWRLGFATGPRWAIEAMGRLQSQAVSHPSSISQKAAIEALTGPQDSVEMMRQAFQRRRDLVVELMKDIPEISFTHPAGAFYIFFNVAPYIGRRMPSGNLVSSADDICEMLLEQFGLALVSGSGFGDSNYIRLSFAASDDDIREGVVRLKKGLAALL